LRRRMGAITDLNLPEGDPPPTEPPRQYFDSQYTGTDYRSSARVSLLRREKDFQ
jgi:hypothetical protein